ncbi:T9SS type A sorting domain-containing protein [bacterium]|nr:T9SS type A sorting domain-containing protein [bacterium]
MALLLIAGLATATDVTFSVNMSYQFDLGNFDPDVDGVGIRGDMNGWAGADGLVDPDEDMIYTTTLDLDAGTYGYKFVIWVANDPDDVVWESTIGDRSVEVAGEPLILDTVWFDDQQPGIETWAVTFHVNMSEWQNLGNFDPNVDAVGIRGDMNGWGAGDNLTDGDQDLIYDVTLDLAAGTYGYKFVVEYGGDPNNAGWEDNINNRSVEVVDADLDLDVVWFDNNSPVQTNYEITFRVNMAQQEALGVFDPDVDAVIIRGGRAEIGNWDGYTQIERLGESMIYSSEIQFDDFEPGNQLDYKFLIDYDNDQADPVEWEQVGGPFDNRNLTPDGTEPDYDNDGYLEISLAPAWFSLAEPTEIANLYVGPYNAPVTVPAGGDNIWFEVHLHHNLGNPYQANLWVSATLPNSNSVNLAPVQVTLQPGVELFFQNVNVNVPAMAPAGMYTISVNGGNYPNFIGISDSFPMEKLATGTNTGNWGWEGIEGEEIIAEDTIGEVTGLPTEFAMNAAYPNPFNPSTAVAIALPQASELNVTVFNVMGQQVATLANGTYNAGEHNFTFNASSLASGIYFIRAEVPGQLNTLQKVTLMK